MPKNRRKPNLLDKFWRATTKFDMFGESIQFNLDGKESYDTCCGSLATLLILGTVAIYALFQVRYYNSRWSEVPIVNVFLKENYYLEPLKISQERDDFYFAVAVTKKQNFLADTAQSFQEAGGSMELTYDIFGGEEDSKTVKINMNPCSDFDWYKPSG